MPLRLVQIVLQEHRRDEISGVLADVVSGLEKCQTNNP